jgi:hypothetical protein
MIASMPIPCLRIADFKRACLSVELHRLEVLKKLTSSARPCVGGRLKRDIFHIKQPPLLLGSDANMQHESTPLRMSAGISGTSRDFGISHVNYTSAAALVVQYLPALLYFHQPIHISNAHILPILSIPPCQPNIIVQSSNYKMKPSFATTSKTCFISCFYDHYMFRPSQEAIFRWLLVNTKKYQEGHYSLQRIRWVEL